jgi:hypothetical protein
MSTRPVESHLKDTAITVQLWLGVLLGPFAALSQLEANYALVLWACGRSQAWPLHLISATAFLITLLGVVVSWRNWRRTGGGWRDEGPGPIARGRFMSVLGLFINVLMWFVILAQWIAIFLHGPCWR